MSNGSKHYFASSAVNWSVGKTVEEVSDKQERLDNTCGLRINEYMIYEVPLPIEAPYKIKDYAPVVEGAEAIKLVRYE